MLNVRLAAAHLYGKLLCIFVLFFFPRDVLDEIWDLIELVFQPTLG